MKAHFDLGAYDEFIRRKGKSGLPEEPVANLVLGIFIGIILGFVIVFVL